MKDLRMLIENIIAEQLDGVGTVTEPTDRILALFNSNLKEERQGIIREVENLKVDVRPEITEWLTHNNRQEAVTYNNALVLVLEKIEKLGSKE
jgi:hypothetical protein